MEILEKRFENSINLGKFWKKLKILENFGFFLLKIRNYNFSCKRHIMTARGVYYSKRVFSCQFLSILCQQAFNESCKKLSDLVERVHNGFFVGVFQYHLRPPTHALQISC